MPILEVEIVGAPETSDGLAARIAVAAGEALDKPGGTWVRLRRLEPADYAESDGGPPAGVAPVFVRVLERAAPDDLDARVERLTDAVAAACGRPAENVHVLYEPPAAGRMAFGGRLVR